MRLTEVMPLRAARINENAPHAHHSVNYIPIETERHTDGVRGLRKQGDNLADIGLIDVDGHNFPNLALMRISAYHKSIGDNVEWWYSDLVHAHRTTTVQDAVSAINTALVKTASCKARKTSPMDVLMKRIISSLGIRRRKNETKP